MHYQEVNFKHLNIIVMAHSTNGSKKSNEAVTSTGESQEKTGNDPKSLRPTENTWISTDQGTTFIADPKQGEEYYFCITITNTGKLNSGPFEVKFVLSGDQVPAVGLNSEKQENLAPGESALICVQYGVFENKFAIYHVGAIVFAECQQVSTDQGFDFTINTE